MKFLACILAFAFVAAASAASLSDEQKAKILAISKECQEKSGISDETIAKLRKGEYEQDAKIDAHLLCFVQKTGVLGEDGEVKTDVFKTKLAGVISDQAKVDEIVTKCAVKKDKPAETAKAILKCLKEAKESSGKDISLI